MAKAYVEYRFSIHPKSPWEEILFAELQELPFESFLETENGFNAYVSLDDHKENFLESIDLLHSNEVEVRFTTSEIAPENWNAKWESNFHPIVNVINRVGNDDLILSFVFHTGLFPGTNRRVKT